MRYGALIFHDIRNEHEKKDKSSRLGHMQTLLNRSFKHANDFMVNMANWKVTKLIGNWNMKTLTLTSYIRAAKI